MSNSNYCKVSQKLACCAFYHICLFALTPFSAPTSPFFGCLWCCRFVWKAITMLAMPRRILRAPWCNTRYNTHSNKYVLFRVELEKSPPSEPQILPRITLRQNKPPPGNMDDKIATYVFLRKKCLGLGVDRATVFPGSDLAQLNKGSARAKNFLLSMPKSSQDFWVFFAQMLTFLYKNAKFENKCQVLPTYIHKIGSRMDKYWNIGPIFRVS